MLSGQNNYTGNFLALDRSLAEGDTGDAGFALNVTQRADDAAVLVDMFRNDSAARIRKQTPGGEGGGPVLELVDGGTGETLNLTALNNQNITIRTSSGTGHWISGNTFLTNIYGNATTDATHDTNGVTVLNNAVTANSIIFITPYGGAGASLGCANCTFFVGDKWAAVGFAINVTNTSTNRAAIVNFSYIIVN
ncbi:hypothetical protein HY572_04645 [Candidatus Micrarchaeota archaeon]|nr:hypothetical protein [Candidatus Micrarchaeota archaeon]